MNAMKQGDCMSKLMMLFLVGLWSVSSGLVEEPSDELSARSEQEIHEQLKSLGDDVATLRALVVLLNKEGRGKEAIPYAERVLDLLPEDADAHFQLAVALRQKMERNSMAWMTGSGKYTGLLKKAIELDPGFLSPYRELFGFYLNAPFIVGGGTGKARDLVHSMEKVNAKEALKMKASILILDKEMEKALGVYQTLNAAYPGDSGILFTYGMLLLEQKQYDQAIKMMDEGMNASGDRTLDCIYQAGKARFLADKDLNVAVSCFDLYIKKYEKGRKPTPSDALWRKGLVLKKLDKKEEAKVCFKEALRLNPDHPEASKALKEMGG
jgi:tetratricopeptide (TPR) repeat protein